VSEKSLALAAALDLIANLYLSLCRLIVLYSLPLRGLPKAAHSLKE